VKPHLSFPAASLLTIALIGIAPSVFAAQPQVSDATLDRIVERLESSGKLDAALERSIERRMQKQQEAKRKQQEEQQAKQKELSKNVRKPDTSRDHLFGNPAAEVTLIEFSDYECPFCKRFHGTPEAVVKHFDGKVNLVWRHFPLDFHNPAAAVEAEAGECVAQLGGNEAFWQYTNALMERTQSNGKGMPVKVEGEHPLLSLAGELKLNKEAFKTCMDQGKGKESVRDDMADGVNAGIEGTPGVILYNNRTGKTDVIPGAQSAEVIQAAVQKLLDAR
jgi:protein-disulfide isomerase